MTTLTLILKMLHVGLTVRTMGEELRVLAMLTRQGTDVPKEHYTRYCPEILGVLAALFLLW
jgi:hypothetical protein